MTNEQQDFVNALAGVSLSLAHWAKEELRDGATVDDLKWRLKRAMQVAKG